MEICVIHGSNRKGNTEKTIDFIKEELRACEKTVLFSDIYLPKDLPHFCLGCFACLQTSDYAGQNCPHSQFTHPILQKLLRSDGIVVTSPSYALAETGQIKAFFDHFACTYVNHRPNAEMYDKIGLVVSTAAGAGTGRAVSTISRNLLFWGVKRVVKCRIHLWQGAMHWDETPVKIRLRAERLLKSKARTFYQLTKKRKQIGACLSSKGIRFAMKRVVMSFPETSPDKIYWRVKGWLS